MKKTLLTLIMLGAIGLFTANAQITLNSTDIVDVGDNVEEAKDTLPGAITIGSGGASQTWNFSSIQQHVLDTLKFRAPSAFPGAVDFPTSNLALQEDDSAWIFLDKNTTGLYVIGIHQIENGQPMSLSFPNTIVTFPSTMGTNYGGTWNGQLFVFPVGWDPDGPGPLPMIDSVRITRESDLSSNIDGWGNVTTPLGTFASLRQIVIEETIDTTWVATNGTGTWAVINPLLAAALNIDPIAYDTTRTARWWSDDPATGFPVVEMDYEANGTVRSVSWLKATPTVGVEEKAEKEITGVVLYPNPAKDLITIETDLTNNYKLEILDVTGKLVNQMLFRSNKISLSTAKLDNGIYFYNIYDENGTILNSNRFVIAK